MKLALLFLSLKLITPHKYQCDPKNINEIAYNLGFDYPQYFNKLFKQKTGKTPVEYRNLI
jgi:AraC-like DNA-binding protein